MAKIMKLLQNSFINAQIDRITRKIKNNQSYPDVLKDRYLAQKEKKLAVLKEKHDKMLRGYAIEALDQKTYQKVFSKPHLEKLQSQYGWKKRRLAHLHHIKKLNDADYAIKLEALEKTYQIKEQSILSKFEGKHQDEQTLKQHQKAYQEVKEKLDSDYQTYLNTLDHLYDEKLTLIKEKLIQENEHLKQKSKTYKEKKRALIENLSSLELPDDVILRLDHLTMTFGGLIAVNDLSFDVKKGEIFGLIGPNGAGKTTVFNCITQFYKSTSGDIYFKDKNQEVLPLNQYRVHDVIKHGIVRTFQNVELIWELSIMDNLLVAGHTMYQTKFFSHLLHTNRFKREEAIIKAKATKVLSDLGLLMYKDFYPIGLPYGVLKMIELARTLMTDPHLIILDEPAAGLNDLETKKLAETIKNIQKTYDATIFLVEHDMSLVMGLCDTVCAISFGKKLAMGTPKEIQSNQLVKDAYLGGE